MSGNINDLTIQNIASQNELRTIHEGIVSNTVKIMSDSELAKQKYDKLEKYYELLAEKVEKISQPPIQPDPIVQTPVKENKEIGQLNDNTSLSSVQKRQSETSQSVENAQSDKFIETHNKGKSVSTSNIVSDSNSTFAKKQLTKLKLKKLKQRRYRLRKKNKMKAIENNDDVETIEDVGELKQDEGSSNENNFLVKSIFECVMSFITAYFNLMTTIFKGSPGILWGVLFLLAFQVAMSKATPTSTNDVSTQTSLTTMLNSQGPSPSFILYTVDAMEASSYTFQMDEIRQEEFSGLATSCSAIPIQHEICLAHPASCQSTQMSIANFEKAIKKHSQTLYSVKRVCELPAYPSSEEIISRCHQGLKWAPREDATKKFKLLTSMFEGFTTDYLRQEKGTAIARPKRFLVSTPILIGTAIGAASIATAGVTAAVIAKSETNRIVEEEQAHRIEDVDNAIHNNWVNLNISVEIAKDIDNIRHTEAWSSHAINTLSHVMSLY